MNKITTIAKKEFFSYLNSPVGYIFAGLLLAVAGWLYFQDFFINGQADLSPFWSTMIFLLSIFVPAISMNLIAEEKKNSTWEVMLSLPISDTEYTLGKFFGAAGFLVLILLLTMPAVATVLILGKPDLGIIGGGVMGTLVLALAYLALGLFASSLSNQPVVGFLVGVVVLMLNNLMGQDVLLSRIPVVLKDVISYLSLGWHANNFANGIISLGDASFYISWIVIFLILTVLTLKARGK